MAQIREIRYSLERQFAETSTHPDVDGSQSSVVSALLQLGIVRDRLAMSAVRWAEQLGRGESVRQAHRFNANAGAFATGALENVKGKSNAQCLRGVGFQVGLRLTKRAGNSHRGLSLGLVLRKR
ncbi:hypothetical protein QMF22_11965 [Cryobacterium sp. PH31-L1]|nr:hypothetical protein [Cryobacterium sp. PH31-L1]